MASKLLDRDYKEIDKDLLGSSIIKEKNISKPSNIAPAQGYIFLALVTSLQTMLKKYSPRYRD